MITLSEQEIHARQSLRLGEQSSALQDLELAEGLLGGGPSDILLGLRFLLRILGDKNAVNVQEQALKIGMRIWAKAQSLSDDPNFTTILSTLPSAGVGAILALLLCRTELTVIALIGIILLIGIVKKNAIMMIDFALEASAKRGKAQLMPFTRRVCCASGQS